MKEMYVKKGDEYSWIGWIKKNLYKSERNKLWAKDIFPSLNMDGSFGLKKIYCCYSLIVMKAHWLIRYKLTST